MISVLPVFDLNLLLKLMFSEYLDSLFETDLDDEIHRPGIVVRRIDFKSTILQI